MDFVNGSLLAGAAFVAVPIVLHLIMRQRPQHLEFPALRFIQRRQDANRRRLKMRHWLLLALRMAALLLLAAALARPSIQAQGLLGDREAPVAAALVFDTMPRMDYRRDNQTRLEAAQDIGRWLLGQLPEESQIAVVDAAQATPAFHVDLGAARQRIDRLRSTPQGQPLWRVCESAAELLARSEQTRKEIYIFTDLAQAAWAAGPNNRLEARLAELRSVGVYIVDVGVESPRNAALGELRLSSQMLARNSPLSIAVDVSLEGDDGQRLVESFITRDGSEPEKRSQETVDLVAGQARAVHAQISGLSEGTHQGYVRIVPGDGLAADDVRYFTVEVRPAWKVLLVAPTPAEAQALYLAEALAPTAFRLNKQARFDCHVVAYEELARQALDEFAAVCLLDPPPLEDNQWTQLAAYASAGGGLAILLGPNAAPPQAFHRPAARELLPGELGSQVRQPEGDVHFTSEPATHPLLAKFRPLAGSVPWDGFPVFRYWRFDQLDAGATVVARYSDDRPALLEKTVGRGRVLVMTTPLSSRPDASESQRWNLLPTGFEPWPFVVLSNEMLLYLVGSADSRLNYESGQDAQLDLSGDQRFATYLLTDPGGETATINADAEENVIRVSGAAAAGNYRIRAGGQQGGFDRGFSVNLPVESTRLARLSESELSEVFGGVPYRVARNEADISRDVTRGRVGQELFPWLVGLLALAMAAEHWLANRFYTESRPTTT